MFSNLITGLKGLIPGSGRSNDGGLEERREHTRRPSSLDVECRVENRDYKVTAIEISPGGVRIRTPETFAVGAPALLSHRPRGVPLGRQRIKAKVIWIKPHPSGGNQLGLQFVDEADNLHHSWVYMVLRKLGMDPYKAFKRKARRIECDASVTMLSPEGEHVAEARIRNIGLGGALLECSPAYPPGKMLTVVLTEQAGLQLAARVVNQRPHGEELHVSVRFLNHPDSPEMNKLKSVLLDLLTKK